MLGGAHHEAAAEEHAGDAPGAPAAYECSPGTDSAARPAGPGPAQGLADATATPAASAVRGLQALSCACRPARSRLAQAEVSMCQLDCLRYILSSVLKHWGRQHPC